MLGALTSYNRRGPSSRGNRTADIAVTIVPLMVHAFLCGATVALLGLLVMVTDSCGYQRCGDPAWIDRAMWLGLGAGAAIFIADLVVAVFSPRTPPSGLLRTGHRVCGAAGAGHRRRGDGITGRPRLVTV
jgi:hypothetical protein